MRLSKSKPFVALLGLLLVAAWARLFFGVSVGDEAFVVTMAYLPRLGGHWFVNDQSIIQMAGILVSPLALAYGLLFGTSGLMLFFRHLELALSLVVAYQLYVVLKSISDRWVAALLAAVVFVFVPNNIATLSYNNLGSLFFGLGTLVAIRALNERRRALAAVSGLAWVAAVFAYPSLVAAFAAFVIPLGYLVWREPPRRREFAAPFLLGAASLTVVLSITLWWCGLDNLMATYAWSRVGAQAGALEKLWFARDLAGSYLPDAWISAPLIIAWGIAGFWAPFGAFAYVLGLVAFFTLGRNSEAPATQVLWPLVILLTVPFLVQRRFRVSRDERRLLWLVIAPAAVGAVVTCLSSRMTLYAAGLTSLFGALALSAMIVGRRRVVGLGCALTLVTASVYWRWAHVYEDGPVPTLTELVRRGPFAGLFTSPQKAAWLARVQGAFDHVHDRTIIVKDMFAAGYLMSKNRPFGPVMWFGAAVWYPDARARYVDVFKDPKTWPEIVVDLTYYPATPSSVWVYNVPNLDPYHDPFKDFFLRTGAYRVVAEDEAYRVLERRPN